jgi:hypothetical protein
MPHIPKRTLGPPLFAGILICFGCIAAQQNPSQQSGRTQSVKPHPRAVLQHVALEGYCSYCFHTIFPVALLIR